MIRYFVFVPEWDRMRAMASSSPIPAAAGPRMVG